MRPVSRPIWRPVLGLATCKSHNWHFCSEFSRKRSTQTLYSLPAMLTQVEAPLKCTIFDERGKVTSVSASLDRKQFLRKNGLYSRDLRHIDGPQRSLVPYIQVQKGNNLLVNICDLRVLIKSNQMFVFHSKDPAIADRLSMLVYDFSAKLGYRERQARRQDYEQMALEIVLIHAVAYLEVELNVLQTRVDKVLKDLEVDLNYDKLTELLRHSAELKMYFRRSMSIRKALDDALDDSSGLLDMYLTDSTRGENPQNYNDIEILLETYYSHTDELVQKARWIVREVNMTEEIMNMVIDANRNSIILFRLEISVLTVGLAFATFFADMYGMNLENFIEQRQYGMPFISAGIATIAVIGTIFNFKRLAYTKRIFMPQSKAKSQLHGHREALKRWLEKGVRPNA